MALASFRAALHCPRAPAAGRFRAFGRDFATEPRQPFFRDIRGDQRCHEKCDQAAKHPGPLRAAAHGQHVQARLRHQRRLGHLLLGALVCAQDLVLGHAQQRRIAAQVTFDENRRAESGEIIGLERKHNRRIECQGLRRLLLGHAARLAFTPEACARARGQLGDLEIGRRHGLRCSASASSPASVEFGNSSLRRRE